MTSPTRQESGPLQEWAPLTTLLQKIPSKIQTGLFTQDINFTCLDAIADFIAIGTNHGVVYWFDRKTSQLETFGCEDSNSIITCVKVVSTVDYMVAAGNNHGVVTIFQVPKQLPDSLPESLKPKKKKQVERFNVSGLHQVSVTTVEWSKNGMKLFSGDENGLVVLTEMDFNLHLSKSTELLDEKYSIVQLSYQSGLLLISTLFRTIIVHNNQSTQIIQVGQKERKMLGKLGAVFAKNKNHPYEPIIYASRPGLRVWQADKNGIVVKTLILKEAVKMEKSRVQLLNPAADHLNRKSQGELTFGIIMPFSDDLLVTYNDDIIYVVNPTEVTISSIVTNLRRVTDVSCTQDEIFILEGDRNILRIAYIPEIHFFAENHSASQSNRPVTWAFTDLTTKLKSSSIVPAIPFHKINPTNLMQSTSILPPVVIGIDTTSIINAEEAIEVPPIIPLDMDTQIISEVDSKESNSSTNNRNTTTNRKDIFQKISEQDFEEVLFTPQKKDKKKKKRMNASHIQTNSQDNQNKSSSVTLDELNQTTQKFDNDLILENGRNLESIQKAVQDKEKLLSNYLSLDLSQYMDKSASGLENTSCNSLVDFNGYMNNSFKCWNTEKRQSKSLTNSMTEKLSTQKSESNVHESNHLAECSTKLYGTKVTNQQSWPSKSGLEDAKISEADFNELSKEFVKSAIYEDSDDWILLG
ncbi:hypothetical protein TSAR_001636 [Trichomalopsis sarcophagae]|uniref:HPS5-like beta-propeller domain-containing protein n=1 Tax=Trichomalopsis sarcophagae TaxID=543379 RepID=A0A232EYE7_9HYME|nr:hypothetical protein TSAR_001636 [Trichomalopsis sarcophagae]